MDGEDDPEANDEGDPDVSLKGDFDDVSGECDLDDFPRQVRHYVHQMIATKTLLEAALSLANQVSVSLIYYRSLFLHDLHP